MYLWDWRRYFQNMFLIDPPFYNHKNHWFKILIAYHLQFPLKFTKLHASFKKLIQLNCNLAVKVLGWPTPHLCSWHWWLPIFLCRQNVPKYIFGCHEAVPIVEILQKGPIQLFSQIEVSVIKYDKFFIHFTQTVHWFICLHLSFLLGFCIIFSRFKKYNREF